MEKVKFKVVGNELIIKSKEFEEESELKVIVINLIAKLKKFLKIFKNIFNDSNSNFGGGFIDSVDLISYNSDYNSAFTSPAKGNVDISKFLKDAKVKNIPLLDLDIYNDNDKYEDIIV